MPEADYHFHLICWDGEVVIGTIDLDHFQLIFDAYNRQIRLSLSGNQVAECEEIPAIISRADVKKG